MGVNFGQTIWDKTQVLLGISWGMHLGTLWEHDGNTLRTRGKKQNKTNPSSPTPSKKTTCFKFVFVA
jgi:hypothetical protein